ncbi:hypothetical protein IMZ31_23660 (plasmid) [Pontibacillus sp. ALD_SL1]|uniref:hypothetical protein n=1 Tax=Pontibacillus sp. ALD_SL1 TaxID=2777185 RepID=UPI001A9688BF|nr:hypothetical protein [Pontibacillus sp. ALD_SL1]QST02449.1 hypothetical protein IMZ31_23660 [Pontibacillus sp. ALD_SL1]
MKLKVALITSFILMGIGLLSLFLPGETRFLAYFSGILIASVGVARMITMVKKRNYGDVSYIHFFKKEKGFLSLVAAITCLTLRFSLEYAGYDRASDSFLLLFWAFILLSLADNRSKSKEREE